MDSETEPLLNRQTDSPKQGATEEYHSVHSDEAVSEIGNGDSPSSGIFQIFTKPTVLGVSMIFVIAGLHSMGASPRETIMFQKACQTNMVDGVCDKVQNQLLVASYEQIRTFTTKLMSLLGLSVMGKISDTYGRSPLLFFFGICVAIKTWGFFMLTYLCYGLQFKSLLFLDIFAALGSNNAMIIAMVNSYISDITTIETRQAAMSFSISLLFASQTIGSLLGTLILGYGKSKGIPPEVNDFVPIWGDMALTVILVGFTAVLPESLDKSLVKAYEPIKWRVPTLADAKHAILSTYHSIMDQMRLLRLPDEYIPVTMKHRATELKVSVLLLVAISSAILVLSDGEDVVLSQYLIYRFEWDSQLLTEFTMVSSIASFFYLAVVFPYVTTQLLPKVFKLKYKPGQIDSLDYVSLALGLIADICTFSLVAVSTSTVQVMVFTALFGYGGSLIPCVNACITKFYPHSKTAEVYMAMGIITNLLGMVVPSALLWFYKFALRHMMPQLSFLVASSVSTLCLVVLGGLFMHKSD